MTRHGFRLTLLLLGIPALTSAGCRRAEFTFFPVEGTVTRHGRPLRDIEVVFFADPEAGTVGPRTSGRTDAAGHYRLRTEHADEGAVAGKHLVLLFDTEAGKKQLLLRHSRTQPPKDTARVPPEIVRRLRDELKTTVDAPRVPPRYGRFNETPLRVEVHSGPQTLDFHIP